MFKSLNPERIWLRNADDGLYILNNRNINSNNILKKLNNLRQTFYLIRRKKTINLYDDKNIFHIRKQQNCKYLQTFL